MWVAVLHAATALRNKRSRGRAPVRRPNGARPCAARHPGSRPRGHRTPAAGVATDKAPQPPFGHSPRGARHSCPAARMSPPARPALAAHRRPPAGPGPSAAMIWRCRCRADPRFQPSSGWRMRTGTPAEGLLRHAGSLMPARQTMQTGGGGAPTRAPPLRRTDRTAAGPRCRGRHPTVPPRRGSLSGRSVPLRTASSARRRS